MTDALNRFWAVVPAAGAGRRMASRVPKQYLNLGGRSVIEHTLERLLDAAVFEEIVVAVSPGDEYWPELPLAAHERIHRVDGGRERADSVLNGLRMLLGVAGRDDWVLVHDAARPCLTREDIIKLINELGDDPVGGILALPVHDTLKRVGDSHIEDTVDRSRIWRAFTPQMFRLGALHDALDTAIRNGRPVTDEASAIEYDGCQPRIVEGRSDNIKITRPEDLPLAGFYLEQQCL